MIRVLLADDEELVRSGLRAIIDAEPDLEVVGEAADGREATALVRRLAPHVVLMDIRMPQVDGIEATRQVSAMTASPAPRVIVLTTFGHDDYVYEALRAARAVSCSSGPARTSCCMPSAWWPAVTPCFSRPGSVISPRARAVRPPAGFPPHSPAASRRSCGSWQPG